MLFCVDWYQNLQMITQLELQIAADFAGAVQQITHRYNALRQAIADRLASGERIEPGPLGADAAAE